ncbi:hypothetical protein P8891_05690 [Bacillus atrophaeus]|uniref:hypothetical protein n=1 Tax=Bacillus atrophaeus TaxID=1452 RepID=UPI002280C28F|nr:hypothetical protein [Bacillus atrophaeus]MCY7947951.1 hypothetical protein [Bacillus atrophaeus]MCY8098250.1 hypothetical protein [Bacillus atrophaeus]MCY9170027.1 hypothetical protein [Bacillus atrophaeus]MEC0740580.1 hypothetical protein [Bacillus atrophaeus]MEC0746984.1 hypothetical protein [Bacillus atrophaeus]
MNIDYFNSIRRDIRLCLESLSSFEEAQEFSRQEQVLDELTEGYLRRKKFFNGNVKNYLEWQLGINSIIFH